jgi:rhodanese-related sulfurtransferase
MALLSKLFSTKGNAAAAAWLDPTQLTALLSGTTPPHIIDVRGPDEFTGPLGHIDQARNVPLDQITAHASELLQLQAPLVMVCHTDRRSAAAAEVLSSRGATKVYILRGGMVAWRSRPPQPD